MGQVWNALVISLFREHLVPQESLHRLLYHEAHLPEEDQPHTPHPTEGDPEGLLEPQVLREARKTGHIPNEVLPEGGEARRRVQFFAQSLAHDLPDALPVKEMPTFTVLTPHYSEKILLPLHEILHHKSENPTGLSVPSDSSGSSPSRFTLLDYLKEVFPDEWRNFVEDSKVMAAEHEHQDLQGMIPLVGGDRGFTTTPRRAWKDLTPPPQIPIRTRSRSNGSEMGGNGGTSTPGTMHSLASGPGEEGMNPCLSLPHTDSVSSTLSFTSSPGHNEEMCRAKAGAFEAYGYHRATPEFTMRTRIWASVRSQTLYRTVSGFMNYSRALSLLDRLERKDHSSSSSLSDLEGHGSPMGGEPLYPNSQDQGDVGYEEGEEDLLAEEETKRCVARKFRMVVAMQRYAHFNQEEREAVHFLLCAYPDLCIAYLEEGEGGRVYSVMIDGRCEVSHNGRRIPRYRIELPGHPILGDGKADNQNHSLIFSRGEFLQMVDANQDQYLEEALKVRNLLGEFELEVQRDGPTSPVYRTRGGSNDAEGLSRPLAQPPSTQGRDIVVMSGRGTDDPSLSTTQGDSLTLGTGSTSLTGRPPSSLSSTTKGKKGKIISPPSPYDPRMPSTPCPVAIVGAREYIFSENIGLLGDVAAGKEATFGTQNQRLLAQLGGRLHYGHPDFLNTIFMSTRGGVSKATKGLHLNEDIYAGIQAQVRGGRIKHAEYSQCGKGRDLGFTSVLSFVTKIGSGMGEQFLSREHYWLGTQLPLDRLLTFYYAHPGFQVNNMCITLATRLLVLLAVCFGVLLTTVPVCSSDVDPSAGPTGCFNVWPLLGWLKRCTIAIIIVLIISFIPLFLQVLTEQGSRRGILRLAKHLLSLSPLLEVFIAQAYAHSALENLAYGGAKYLGTGRSVATRRLPFSELYVRYSGPAVHLGIRSVLLLIYATIVIWIPHLTYFWIVASSMILAPFIFNPHQFNLGSFFLDYLAWWRWLWHKNVPSKGSSNEASKVSWASYTREGRAKILGSVRSSREGVSKPEWWVWVGPELGVPLVESVILLLLYTLLRAGDDERELGHGGGAPGGVLRLIGLALIPILLGWGLSALIRPFTSILILCHSSDETEGQMGPGERMRTGMVRTGVLVAEVVCVLVFWWLEGWDRVDRAIMGLIAGFSLQRSILRLLTVMLLGREQLTWSGAGGYGGGLRGFVVEGMEASYFAADAVVGHLIQVCLLIPCLIPFADRVHTMMLLWVTPNKQGPAYYGTRHSKAGRVGRMMLGAGLFTIFTGLFFALLLFPLLSPSTFPAIPDQKIL